MPSPLCISLFDALSRTRPRPGGRVGAGSLALTVWLAGVAAAASPPIDDPDADPLADAPAEPAVDRRRPVEPDPTDQPTAQPADQPASDADTPDDKEAVPALPDEPPVDPATLVASGAPHDPGDAIEADDSGWVWPEYLTGWKRRVEIGAFGASGNTSTTSFRGSLRTTRKVPTNETTLNLTYQYATRDGSVIQNRLQTTGRYDKLKKDSRWRYFVSGSYEADEFRDWDYRLTGGGGFGFELIKDDKTTLLSRGGLSLAQDFGGLDEELRTEAILGLDLTHKISERQKISGKIDYLPNTSALGEYRINAKADWQLLIDPETRLSLRIGGEDRFDSNARGKSKENDLTYYIVLAIEF